MAAWLKVNSSVSIPFSDMEVSYVLASGPGGQNVNKVHSACVIRLNLRTCRGFRPLQRERVLAKLDSKLTGEGEILIRSQKFRDQNRNREDALEKLSKLLRQALYVPKKRLATKPTRASLEKRIESKKRVGEKKQSRQKPRLSHES